MFGQHYLIISDLSANGPTKWKKHLFAGVMLEDMKRSIECHSDWFIGIHTGPAQARSYFYMCNMLFIWNYFTKLSCAVTALSEYIQEHVCVCVSKKWFQIMWWLLLVFWEMLFTSPFLWSFFQWLAPPGYFSMDLLQRQTQTNSQLLCKSRSIHIWLQISTSSIILILLIEELLNLVIGSLSIA